MSVQVLDITFTGDHDNNIVINAARAALGCVNKDKDSQRVQSVRSTSRRLTQDVSSAPAHSEPV